MRTVRRAGPSTAAAVGWGRGYGWCGDQMARLDTGQRTRCERYDAVDLFAPALLGHDFDRFVVVLYAGGRVTIVRHPIAVFAEQLHGVGELAQHAGHFSVLHTLVFSSARARAKMASNIGTVSLRVNVFC